MVYGLTFLYIPSYPNRVMAACYDNGANGNHHIQEATCIKSCLHFTIIHIKLNYLNILLKYIVMTVLSLLHMFV